MPQILSEVPYCQKIITTKFNKPLRMTDVEEQKFKVAKVCHICGHQYTWYKETDIRVKDHCHITGQ